MHHLPLPFPVVQPVRPKYRAMYFIFDMENIIFSSFSVYFHKTIYV